MLPASPQQGLQASSEDEHSCIPILSPAPRGLISGAWIMTEMRKNK
jgi:hypothetical protein